MKMRAYVIVTAAAIAICVPVAIAVNGPASGGLDPSFGTRGRVIVTPSDSSRARAAVVQPDRKIVLAGFVADRPPPGQSSNADFLAIRLNRSGGLDRTFGAGGIVRTPIDLGGTNNDYAEALALGPEGSIVLAGQAYTVRQSSDLVIVRYTPSGALDTSFSGDGILTLDMGQAEDLLGVAVQPDGKIVAVGYERSGFMVLRLLPDGALDKSFGSGGIVDTNVGDPRYRDVAKAVVVLDDGKIVVAGTNDVDQPTYFPFSEDFTVVRYLPSGRRDPGFGSDGIVVTPGPNVEGVSSLAAAPDGKIVVAGDDGVPGVIGRTHGHFDFHLARYLPSGALDATFGSGGTVTTPFAGMTASASSVAVEPHGKVLAGGTVWPEPPFPAGPKFAVAGYNVDGTLDDTYGVHGKRTYDVLSGADYGSALAIQRAAARSGADRLVLAGDSQSESDLIDDHVVAIGIDLGPPARCRVPRVVGLTLGRARARVRSAHCKVGRVRHMRSARRRGRVISQLPRPGRRLPHGSRVNLVVSRGR